MSPKELETLHFVAAGLTAKEIALRTGRSEQTVKNRMAAVRCELGALSAAHAVALAFRLGILK